MLRRLVGDEKAGLDAPEIVKGSYSVFQTDVVQAFRPAQTADLKVRTTRE